MDYSKLSQFKKPIAIALLGSIAIGCFIVFYHYFDPTHNIYAPKCLVKTLTGHDCPGCGCQRLLYQWAHGHFIEGIRYNYFFPIGLLYVFLICWVGVSLSCIVSVHQQE